MLFRGLRLQKQRKEHMVFKEFLRTRPRFGIQRGCVVVDVAGGCLEAAAMEDGSG